MSIVLDPSKNFVTIQLMYIEEKDAKHGNTRYHFVNSRAEFDNWKAKGYLTEEEMEKAVAVPAPSPKKEQPGMPVQPAVPPQDPTKIISVLRTWWSRMTWKEQNQIYSRCLKQVHVEEGKTRTELDMISYRDLKLKTCLKKCDLKDESKQEVPITENIIDQLVPEVAQELLSNFEMVTEASDDQLKN